MIKVRLIRITDHRSLVNIRILSEVVGAGAPLAMHMGRASETHALQLLSTAAEPGEAAESAEAGVRERLLGLDSAWV